MFWSTVCTLLWGDSLPRTAFLIVSIHGVQECQPCWSPGPGNQGAFPVWTRGPFQQLESMQAVHAHLQNAWLPVCPLDSAMLQEHAMSAHACLPQQGRGMLGLHIPCGPSMAAGACWLHQSSGRVLCPHTPAGASRGKGECKGCSPVFLSLEGISAPSGRCFNISQ